MKRIFGEVQRRLMIFGLSNNYVYSFMGLLIGIFTVYKNVAFSGEKANNNNLEYMIILISLFSILFKFYYETVELKEKNNEFFEIYKNSYKHDVRKNIKLPKDYLDSGYEIREYNSEKYIISNSVNEKIYSDEIKFQLEYAGNFILADEIKQIAPFALNGAFNSKNTIYNSKLIRLADDILIGDNEKELIRIQKTDYFQGLCTNEVVYQCLKSMTRLHDTYIFEGKHLLVNENDELYKLSDSYCSNYLGGSTLAITSDNYIIINKQSCKSAVNSNRLAPSGSGSTDYRDYKKLNKNKRLKQNQTFQELVKITMERELREECGLLYKNIKMKSKVIGFTRLIERGGKPDFFGITYIDAKYTDIKKSVKEEIEVGDYEIKNIKFFDTKDIPNHIFNEIKENEGNVSIQVYIIAEILKCFYDRDIDLYEDLKNSYYS